MSLMKRLKKNSTIEGVSALSESKFFNRETVPTDIPLLNVALSGDINGGLSSGITMICGESKSFKSGFLVQMVLAHQKKYGKKSICLYYDSEFSPVEYYEKQGVKLDQMLHIPVTTVEELKNDIASQLKEISIEEPEHVIILIDSIGGLASNKEAEDSAEGKSTVDMTRAKALNSFFRIVTPHLNMKNIPMVLINSHYETMEMFSKKVVAGGKKAYLSSDDVWFITRAQDKEGKELKGYFFNITADKSRTVKEGSKFPINVTWEDGINKNSGLFDLSVEAGIVVQSGAWYQAINPETGELYDKKLRRTQIECDAFYDNLLKNKTFIEYVKGKYLL